MLSKISCACLVNQVILQKAVQAFFSSFCELSVTFVFSDVVQHCVLRRLSVHSQWYAYGWGYFHIYPSFLFLLLCFPAHPFFISPILWSLRGAFYPCSTHPLPPLLSRGLRPPGHTFLSMVKVCHSTRGHATHVWFSCISWYNQTLSILPRFQRETCIATPCVFGPWLYYQLSLYSPFSEHGHASSIMIVKIVLHCKMYFQVWACILQIAPKLRTRISLN